MRPRWPPDRLGRYAYAGYVWLALTLIGVCVWPAVVLSRNRTRNWQLTRAAGALLARLSGISLTVTGSVPKSEGPLVIVANHASFIDGLVLVLLFPEPVAIVAGGELAHQRIAGPFLRNLGCEFVLSGTDLNGRSNIERLAAVLASGRSLALFPEASLSSDPGIRRFHLGAFAIAVQAGVSVLPVGINGSREVTPPGRRAPRRGRVSVHIGDAVRPAGTDRRAMIVLRDAVRSAVVELCDDRNLRQAQQDG